MHFHDLRHTHKTWLIEDGVPEVLQHKRIGHEFRGVMGVYSHVTRPMVDAMLEGLQARWEQNVSKPPDLFGVNEADMTPLPAEMELA